MADGRRAAVLGSPVAHSLSPALHAAAYAALGLTGWTYERIECREEQLAGLVDGLGPEWVGLSLTMPLKRIALEVADEVTPLAAAVGAANTLLLDGRRRADNTDVAGLAGALREAGVERAGSAVVLGAGGTAHAALAALRDLGVERPTVLVREPARAGELRAAAERLGVRPVVRGGLLDGPLPAADVVVSTLPAGAADPLARLPWIGRPVVLDAVYAGWPTPLARSAAAAGCTVVSGTAMLLHQAVEQVRLMTGQEPPLDALRAALRS
ncbi:MAG TPA: shikimate dehydrogenase [Kineosporiaceae bacterium]|nr:shikimate dehydrogenase [Kineosporiaceae bacterium]